MAFFGKHPTARLVAGIALPALIVMAGAISAVVISLSQMAVSVNDTELSLTRKSANAAVSSLVRRIEDSVGDYANWDDAVVKLAGVPDADFVDQNFIQSTASPVYFDTAYVIDRSGRGVVAVHDGEVTTTPARDAFGPSLTAMLAELPVDGRTFDSRGGVVRGAWGLAVAAVAPIVPVSATVTLDPAKTRFLVVSRALDADAIQRLGEDYLIDGLSLTEHDAGVTTEIPVKSFTATTIAYLTWSPRHLGSAAQASVSPLALAMLVLLGMTMLILVAVAIASLVRVRRGQERAEYGATHDMLTGLPNRTALVERLRRAILAMRRGGTSVAVAYLDLDGFKEVNDTYGHEIGDILLCQVADAFKRLAGDNLLVRLGGDEFAVVVESPNATTVADKVGNCLVDFFDERLLVEGRVIALSTSVGIVTVDSTGVSVEELLRRADVAMYQAKQLGRDRVCHYDRSLDAVRIERIEIAASLRRALHTGGLELFYQPIVDAGDGETVGVEALLRWPGAPDGIGGPADFIPVAEETDLIDEIGLWTLRRACHDALAWPAIKVAVNVSPAQFRNPNFASNVAAVLRDVGFPAERLELEVTETFLVAHPGQAAAAINGLRALGVAVALDDFGTGYSSIGYLRSFAFDKLKIDGELVAGIERDTHARDLVLAAVYLARALDLTVTAEGVDTEAEAIILRAAGCQTFQGFHFGRPGRAATISARLSGEHSALAMTA